MFLFKVAEPNEALIISGIRAHRTAAIPMLRGMLDQNGTNGSPREPKPEQEKS